MKIKEIKSKKIVIATHVFATGPAQDLRDYLNDKKIKKVMFIGHPLFYDKNLPGFSYTIYQIGKIKKRKTTRIKKRPEMFEYISAATKNIVSVIKSKTIWDIFIGSNCLNATTGVILKKFGLVNKCVYYVVDYNPKRFGSPILNKIYSLADKFAAKYSDETWNLSPRMIEARKKFSGINKNQKIVPMGIWFNRIKRLPFENIEKNTLVFMGHILKKQGIQHVLQAIPSIVKEIPNFKFVIVGTGKYLANLENLIKSLDIKEYVIFTGYIEDHKDLEKILAKKALAIAPYEKFENKNLSFTYYSDPGKVKVYLGCGLPILLPDIFYNAKYLEKIECAKIIDTKPDNIAKNVISMLKDEETLKIYRKNAVNYASTLDWNIIFKKALENLI